jgi:hypothetical protein
VLACFRELATLLLDLAEQTRVLNGQHRLRGERFDEVDGVRRELTRCLAAHDQRAHNFAGTHERDKQPCPVTGAQERVVDRCRRQVPHIGHLVGLVRLGQLANGLGDFGMQVVNRRDQLLAHAVRRAQPKLLLPLIENIDRARFGAGKLRRLGDDSIEHGLQVERRVDRLGHLAERTQLPDRAREIGRARLHFVEQPHVLDRDHRLVGEGTDQLDLLFGERLDDRAHQSDDPHRGTFAQQWDPEHRAIPGDVLQVEQRVLGIGKAIANIDGLPSRIGCKSNFDRLMTVRTSAVAVCCSSRLLKFVVFGPISGFEDLLVGGPVE